MINMGPGPGMSIEINFLLFCVFLIFQSCSIFVAAIHLCPLVGTTFTALSHNDPKIIIKKYFKLIFLQVLEPFDSHQRLLIIIPLIETSFVSLTRIE